MFVRGIIVLLCVLVAISDGAKEPDCKGDPDVCTAEYKPVCGTNGITYGNECELCAAIKRSCTRILIQNEGLCENAQTVAISDGAREPNCCKYPSDGCLERYEPVCGSNGITYDSECELCAAIKRSCTPILIQNKGPCENAQTVAVSVGAREPNCCKYLSDGCPKIYEPVCGSNGITYGNECELCAAIKAPGTQILLQNEGPCVGWQKKE